MARLRLTADEVLDHVVNLGRQVFVEPGASSQLHSNGVESIKNDHLFDVEHLRVAVRAILEGHGLDEDAKMIEGAISGEQSYAWVNFIPLLT